MPRSPVRDHVRQILIGQHGIGTVGRHGDPGRVEGVVHLPSHLDVFDELCIGPIANELADGEVGARALDAGRIVTVALDTGSHEDFLAAGNVADERRAGRAFRLTVASSTACRESEPGDDQRKESSFHSVSDFRSFLAMVTTRSTNSRQSPVCRW